MITTTRPLLGELPHYGADCPPGHIGVYLRRRHREDVVIVEVWIEDIWQDVPTFDRGYSPHSDTYAIEFYVRTGAIVRAVGQLIPTDAPNSQVFADAGLYMSVARRWVEYEIV